MTEFSQQNLFGEPTPDEQAAAEQAAVDAELTARAERIAANARYEGPADRTSEAAKDQGWGQASESTPQSPHETTSDDANKVDRRTLSSKGKLAADREPDTEHNAAYQDWHPLTEQERAAAGRGPAAMREALEQERARRRSQGQ